MEDGGVYKIEKRPGQKPHCMQVVSNSLNKVWLITNSLQTCYALKASM